ncbi:MAG: nucleotidyltransferase family protein [Deltaproteobacteria bacterium]|nr:nucleotidyltransferase family protein [Deltaproteobacteria bacterium]MBW2136908.1 nucleotidyltransferase family protein [Deltaproteobacteria bacterium]
MAQSPEQRILAGLSMPDPHPSMIKGLHTFTSSNLDLDGLIETSIKEGLACILYRNLERSGALGYLNPGQCEKLRSMYYQALTFNITLLHDLIEVLDGLNKRNTPVVLLQGMGLIRDVYVDIGLRPMTDIDLWVLPSGYPSLKDILSCRGYQTDPLYPHTFRRGMTTLDIHTHVLWADRIRSRRLLLDLDEAEIYRRAIPIKVDGRDALRLSPPDEVIYLGLHAIKHNMSRLIWLADIRNIVEGWDKSAWSELLVRARQLGQTRTLRYLIFLLGDIFGLVPPGGIARNLGKGRLTTLEKGLLKKRIRGHPLPRWSPLFLFSAGKGLRKSVPFLAETLFPRPDVLRQVFPSKEDRSALHLYRKRALQIARWCRNALLEMF